MKHRLLIIGVGSIGERQLRCAQRTGRADIFVCEINNDLRRRVTDRYGITEHYADFTEALAGRPSSAVICVPAPLHVTYATQLAEAGSHILIEKPLSTSLEGVEQLGQLIIRRNVVAAVAYVYRANPSLAAMRQALHANRFGRPVQLVAMCGSDFAFHRPAYASTYYRERVTGGGAIQDALTHIINAGEWLVGPVERVLADAAHQLIPHVEVEDTIHVIARQQGIPACYTLNQYQAPDEFTMTIACEKGTVRYEDHKNRWRWIIKPGGPWQDEFVARLERDDLYISQLNSFFDAIESGRPLLCTLDEGIQTLKVNLAILRSLDDVRWTKLAQENTT